MSSMTKIAFLFKSKNPNSLVPQAVFASRAIWLAGPKHRSGALPLWFVPQGARQTIEAIPVYRSNERRGVDVRQAADSVVLVHSPRAGRRFAALVNQAGCERNSMAIAAISNAAAESTGDGWAQIKIAEAPSEDALLALAARLCNKPDPQ